MSASAASVLARFDPLSELDAVDAALGQIDRRCQELVARYRDEALRRSLPAPNPPESRTRI